MTSNRVTPGREVGRNETETGTVVSRSAAKGKRLKDDDELAGILVRRVKHVTTKAILCEVQGLELWIPKSQVHESWRWYRGMSGAMQVTYWWLEANELEHLAGADDAEPQRVAAGLTKAHRIYRQIAAKYHPDRSPDTQEFMKDINALWQAVLTDMKGR